MTLEQYQNLSLILLLIQVGCGIVIIIGCVMMALNFRIHQRNIDRINGERDDEPETYWGQFLDKKEDEDQE